MNPQTPVERKLCLFQWVAVLLMGLLGGVIGFLMVPESALLIERLPGMGIGLMVGLTVSGMAMSFYLRWKRSRRRG